MSMRLIWSLCARDYEKLCPRGWEDADDGQTCHAPATYKGPCGRSGIFLYMSPDAKKKLETDCEVRWPCQSVCNHDYTQLCPQGWIDIGGGKCRAPAAYMARCSREFTFALLNEVQKQHWSASCSVHWPCVSECERDYLANCPMGWTDLMNGTCVAPPSYTKCKSEEPLALLKPALKMAFAKRCDVLYPCKSTCDKDYSFVCPRNWPLADDLASCKPPPSYFGECGDENYDLFAATVEDKKEFESKCGVQWPCKLTCSRDYTSKCPVGWSIGADGISCHAPSSYRGRCARAVSFASVEEKRAFASKCADVFWPCEHEAALQHMMVKPVAVEVTPSGFLLPRVRSVAENVIGGGPVRSDTGQFVISRG
ncbi:unnamed protein product [Vitrella brassicaformis CCMP3155]|uniref:CPW-WPC domain-containing protein n=1 Tax=Vitrella brassicaformis (strain CCMP3155) TaxID=1169540 RepID=A0A0G4EXM8_VITBC|nr:unnamed protein product [Vitrella brassicaformis CCMP3155]|eukprot:CEM03364.1 unnamed protein product [Vitrella brassicaformis CCMP3155]